jgi:coenzyme F420-reducing hydrogenase alpha subunit
MIPLVFWLTVVTVTIGGKGGYTTEFVVGGYAEAACEQARENVLTHAKAAGYLGGLRVKRVKATACLPMEVVHGADALDEEED